MTFKREIRRILIQGVAVWLAYFGISYMVALNFWYGSWVVYMSSVVFILALGAGVNHITRLMFSRLLAYLAGEEPRPVYITCLGRQILWDYA